MRRGNACITTPTNDRIGFQPNPWHHTTTPQPTNQLIKRRRARSLHIQSYIRQRGEGARAIDKRAPPRGGCLSAHPQNGLKTDRSSLPCLLPLAFSESSPPAACVLLHSLTRPDRQTMTDTAQHTGRAGPLPNPGQGGGVSIEGWRAAATTCHGIHAAPPFGPSSLLLQISDRFLD